MRQTHLGYFETLHTPSYGTHGEALNSNTHGGPAEWTGLWCRDVLAPGYRPAQGVFWFRGALIRDLSLESRAARGDRAGRARVMCHY